VGDYVQTRRGDGELECDAVAGRLLGRLCSVLGSLQLRWRVSTGTVCLLHDWVVEIVSYLAVYFNNGGSVSLLVDVVYQFCGGCCIPVLWYRWYSVARQPRAVERVCELFVCGLFAALAHSQSGPVTSLAGT
jgi:hypothetical protein